MDLTRRQFLAAALHAGLIGSGMGSAGCAQTGAGPRREPGILVNDVHSRLNPTWVSEIARPGSAEAVGELVLLAGKQRQAICIAGGRHAMGGQQFRSGGLLLDTAALDHVGPLDLARGTVEVGAGVRWPRLIEALRAAQPDETRPWTIIQKQTGADALSLGGALAANVHGRALDRPPIVAEIESFTLVGPDGLPRRCSRQENSDLFRLVIGGYGLFGVTTALTLRLMWRHRLRRDVQTLRVDDLINAFNGRLAAGYTFGDFQFAVDRRSSGFLQDGVFACYKRVPDDTPVTSNRVNLAPEEWGRLIELAHTRPSEAYRRYVDHYLASSGQVYDSDTFQFSDYIDDYHEALDRRLGSAAPASEMITELYVPREALASFMRAAADLLRRRESEIIYGTIRLIRRDDETFLAWARRDYACIVLNLHVPHTPAGIARRRDDFRGLIELALPLGGSFYLTYHRWATRSQIQAAYPQMPQFLRLKQEQDPQGRFQSDWYRHMATLFQD